MEEQEKIDIRNHLIGWIDEFLENGIIPQVVNPKAIRSNYILKSKVIGKIDEYINSLLENLDEDRRWCDMELVDNLTELENEILGLF